MLPPCPALAAPARSRNTLLTPGDRHLAPCIYRALSAAKAAAESGAVASAAALQKQVADAITGEKLFLGGVGLG